MDKGQQFPDVPDELYHGTAVELGGKVLPAEKHGGESVWGNYGSNRGQRSADHAFATSDEGAAWSYAKHTAKHLNDERAYVAKVSPDGPISRGQFHHQNNEYIAPSYTVTDRIDTMPGRQGTIPQVNWNDYRPGNSYTDANHPEYPSGPKVRRRSDGVDVPERVHSRQMDLFTGNTVLDTIRSPHTDQALGKYHQNAFAGYNDQSEAKRDTKQQYRHSRRKAGAR